MRESDEMCIRDRGSGVSWWKDDYMEFYFNLNKRRMVEEGIGAGGLFSVIRPIYLLVRAVEDRRCDLPAEGVSGVAKVDLQDLSDVHTGRNAQWVQSNIQRCAVRQERHILLSQTCFCIETLLNEMADKVGISPWEIRYRNAIRPGGVLPNGQIVDGSTGLVETLEAVKPYYDEAVKNGDPVGLACAMKNAGVGVGIPDTCLLYTSRCV